MMPACLALLRKNQDLINIGAYAPGSNAEIDLALRLQQPLRQFLMQKVGEGFPAEKAWTLLENILTPTPKVK